MTASRCCAAVRPLIIAWLTSTMPLNVSGPSVQLRGDCHWAMLPYASRQSAMKPMSLQLSLYCTADGAAASDDDAAPPEVGVGWVPLPLPAAAAGARRRCRPLSPAASRQPQRCGRSVVAAGADERCASTGWLRGALVGTRVAERNATIYIERDYVYLLKQMQCSGRPPVATNYDSLIAPCWRRPCWRPGAPWRLPACLHLRYPPRRFLPNNHLQYAIVQLTQCRTAQNGSAIAFTVLGTHLLAPTLLLLCLAGLAGGTGTIAMTAAALVRSSRTCAAALEPPEPGRRLSAVVSFASLTTDCCVHSCRDVTRLTTKPAQTMLQLGTARQQRAALLPLQLRHPPARTP